MAVKLHVNTQNNKLFSLSKEKLLFLTKQSKPRTDQHYLVLFLLDYFKQKVFYPGFDFQMTSVAIFWLGSWGRGMLG